MRHRAPQPLPDLFLWIQRLRVGGLSLEHDPPLGFTDDVLDHIANLQRQRERGYLREAAHDYLRPENRQLLYSFQGFRHLTLEDIERTERACFGAPEEVRDYLIDLADSLGPNTLLLSFNQGALPHELFVQNL